MQYVLFTDNLSDLTLPEVCRGVRQAGFDGLDLTLRGGGHVLPENAEMGLAAAQQAAQDEGLVLGMVTTSVTSRESEHAEDVFAAAAHYDIRRLKLGYWPYEPFGTLAQQIADARRDLEGLITLGSKYGVIPCVHAHSGRLLANGGAFLYLLLKDFDPATVGAYVDPMHMTVEGGLAGWEMGLDLVAAWIALVGIKNFRWVEQDRDQFGQARFATQYVPLADGQAPLPEFMARLHELRYDGTVSLHSEYKGRGSFRTLTSAELFSQSAADLKFLKTLAR